MEQEALYPFVGRTRCRRLEIWRPCRGVGGIGRQFGLESGEGPEIGVGYQQEQAGSSLGLRFGKYANGMKTGAVECGQKGLPEIGFGELLLRIV